MVLFFQKALRRTYVRYALKRERQYEHRQCKLSYLFFKEKSDKLLVVFSGFPGKGRKAVYNYIMTFRNLKCNKLYILDNFGFDKRGAYYLGHNRDFFIERATTELIQRVLVENNILREDVITVGSSKGGFAAVYFAVKMATVQQLLGVHKYYWATIYGLMTTLEFLVIYQATYDRAMSSLRIKFCWRLCVLASSVLSYIFTLGST